MKLCNSILTCKSKRNLHYLKSLYITTLIYIGLEQFFKHKIMDSAVLFSDVSRSCADAEKTYVVIDSTSACECLEEYALGLRFILETDQKPLLTTTDLS